jgi:hypothetical protein
LKALHPASTKPTPRIFVKQLVVWRLWLFVLVPVLGACALPRPQPTDADTAIARLFRGGEWMKTGASSHCYSKTDILRMEELREFGEDTKDVIRVVGGTMSDVLEVEQRLRYLRRGLPDTMVGSDPQSCASPGAASPYKQ